MPFKPGQSGNPKGRTKGSQNKVTKVLKDSILDALEEAGGEGGSVGYLRWLAHEHPPAFAGLVGKVLPMTIAGTEQDGKVGVEVGLWNWNVVDPRAESKPGESVPPAPEAGAV
jgi:hypothetical protein